MDKGIPVYDDHFHMSPSGRNVEALKEFKAAGGTGITLVTLPYGEVRITSGADFAESYRITYALAAKAADLDLEINIAVGPYPVLIVPLAAHYGLEAAEDMMTKGMEAAGRDVAEGRACAIGEIGRPHFPVEQGIMDASNRILLRGMELAKENDCPVIIHSESGTIETNRSLAEIAAKAGLDPGLVIKHSSPPFVTDAETFGVMPSIPASMSNIKEAVGKGSSRFMIETDFIDDPAKPQAVMAPNTVPNKVRQMLGSGLVDAEFVRRICGDIPDSLYHR